MDLSNELAKETRGPTDSKEPEGRMDYVSGVALREWAKCVEQDSQAETFEYLGESVAATSGE